MDNFTYVVADYVNKLPDDCDIIASALSIHHLENNVKFQLYENIFNKLNENGVFINLDQLCGDSDIISHAYDKWWFNNIDKSGIDNEAKGKWIVRKSLDLEISLSQSMTMLKPAGFKDVQCIYSFMKFSTIIAIKQIVIPMNPPSHDHQGLSSEKAIRFRTKDHSDVFLNS